ncbi:glycoside hydrolase family 113, partial [Xanthomonas sp. SHU 199]|uniref:glycoside hydrolase family 113 n=1 Tax=Xanthomonas sp. SHU 199 TaxID=1591174 RepID=UPI00037B5ACF
PSLYPALAAAPEQRRAQMRAAAARVQALGERSGRPVWVAELGLRSAHGSLAAPWESPEQRTAEVDTALQAQVLREWREVLDAQPRIAGIALWCWYTDPDAGGARDSDFTVQHKPAQAVLKR